MTVCRKHIVYGTVIMLGAVVLWFDPSWGLLFGFLIAIEVLK